MAVAVGQEHLIGGVIGVQILKDSNPPNPDQPFLAQITAPGFSTTVSIADGASKQFQLPGVEIAGAPVNPTVSVEVDNFTYEPPGTDAANYRSVSFLLVFKLIEIFKITIGSVPVTAAR